jgi:hypothetical protein
VYSGYPLAEAPEL